MNYCDNKNLKEDMESLNDRLYEVWREVKRMEQTYRWNSDNLADRLAGKIISDIQEDLADIVKNVNETAHLFIE
ncbi:hypothetical protein F0327_25310 [Citrobacter braakii]|nr:hypothetical protein F0327_25310 [Citrobacter braakii]